MIRACSGENPACSAKDVISACEYLPPFPAVPLPAATACPDETSGLLEEPDEPEEPEESAEPEQDAA